MSKLCFLISVQCPSLMVENVLKGNGCQADSLSPPASHPPALQHCQAGEVDLSAWVPSQLRQGASPPCGTCRVAPHAGSRGHLGCGAQKAAPEPGAGLGLGLFPSSLVATGPEGGVGWGPHPHGQRSPDLKQAAAPRLPTDKPALPHEPSRGCCAHTDSQEPACGPHPVPGFPSSLLQRFH